MDVQGTTAEVAVAMDVNGRAYCGCGASFCMQLERKLEKGYNKDGAYPMSTRQLIDHFRY